MKQTILYLLLFISIATYSQKRKFGKVKKEELAETFYEKDSLCDAVYLYKKRETALEYQKNIGIRTVTKIHNIVKIYNKDAFDYATQSINYYAPQDRGSDHSEKISQIKATTYNLENDKIVKTKLNLVDVFTNQKNKYTATKKFTMPNIKIGSVIEYSYTISSPYWSINDLNFQYGIPVKELHYTVKIAEYFKFNQRTKGYYTITPKTEIKSKISPYGV